jgi:hypothetical protein
MLLMNAENALSTTCNESKFQCLDGNNKLTQNFRPQTTRPTTYNGHMNMTRECSPGKSEDGRIDSSTYNKNASSLTGRRARKRTKTPTTFFVTV